mmetsp:Transcript_34163/g.109681  ORF Transcript_34163/g.109681 Transcript_34163/m.109681 type:complete len:186 (-) Transcript_34163:312-869(-)
MRLTTSSPWLASRPSRPRTTPAPRDKATTTTTTTKRHETTRCPPGPLCGGSTRTSAPRRQSPKPSPASPTRKSTPSASSSPSSVRRHPLFFSSLLLLRASENISSLSHCADIDGSGSIDRDELTKYADEVNECVSPKDVDRCIEAIDSDGDRCVTLKDWVVFAAKLKAAWELQEAALGPTTEGSS